MTAKRERDNLNKVGNGIRNAVGARNINKEQTAKNIIWV